MTCFKVANVQRQNPERSVCHRGERLLPCVDAQRPDDERERQVGLAESDGQAARRS
jgi:hypothetical protein